MAMQNRTVVNCPRCGNRFESVVNSLIDPQVDPQLKVDLLGGRLNAAQCSRCGAVNNVLAPLVYHDAQKELLITFVPFELNLPKDRQEKFIGDMMRDITQRLPQDGRKGYLFRPREALTLQGMIDQVLEADGITPDMMEAQRAKMRLAETLVQTPEATLATVVTQNDAQIDMQLFQMLTLMAQRALQEGRQDVAQHILTVQGRVVELSSAGKELIAQNARQEQTVQEVAAAIQALGQNATRADFMQLAISYAEEAERLQALVGLVRPAFDPQFMQELAMTIAQAPVAERAKLENMRDQIMQYTAAIDQQTQMALQQSAQLLQALLQEPNPGEIIRQNADLVDDTFMAVLTANIQEAERQRDVRMSSRLKEIYNEVVTVLRDNMQPEMRFLNDVLGAPSEEAAKALVAENARTYGESLLDVIDAVEEMMVERGDPKVLARLASVRQEAERILG
jgi:hypothetical protein